MAWLKKVLGAELEEQLEQLTGQLAEEADKATKLERELEEVRDRLAAKEQELEQAVFREQSLSESVVQAQDRLDEVERRKKEVPSSRETDGQRKVGELEHQLAELGRERDDLKRRYGVVRSRSESLSRERRAAQQRADVAEADLEKLRAELDEARAAQEARSVVDDSQLSGLQGELDEARRNVEQLQAELDREREDFARATAEHQRTLRGQGDQEGTVGQLEHRIEEISSELENAMERLGQSEQALQQAEERFEQSEQERRQAQERLEQVEQGRQQTQERLERAEQSLREAEDQIAAGRQEVVSASERSESLAALVASSAANENATREALARLVRVGARALGGVIGERLHLAVELAVRADGQPLYFPGEEQGEPLERVAHHFMQLGLLESLRRAEQGWTMTLTASLADCEYSARWVAGFALLYLNQLDGTDLRLDDVVASEQGYEVRVGARVVPSLSQQEARAS